MGGSGGEDSPPSSKPATGKFVVNGVELDREDTRQGRVLYDYEAVGEEELTVYCNQVRGFRPQTILQRTPLEDGWTSV